MSKYFVSSGPFGNLQTNITITGPTHVKKKNDDQQKQNIIKIDITKYRLHKKKNAIVSDTVTIVTRKHYE